ncbi:P1 family peptidase [Wukongibacter sp. M2B1]|uniref:DmpA family aminopeptidase n=1 Tax=Wukongibacter sp. M2B1 TaxID=3088895 RepID=UPI003D7AC6B9
MKGQKRIRDYGIIIGEMQPGKKNAITDVEGVKVGHITLNDECIKTGVTAILPHEENLFKEKVIAASHVINGFGKTAGTIQIDELGNIETPLILTNTLSVGTAHAALVKYILKDNEDIGATTGTVNPIICECNDGYLNDIRGMHVKNEHILRAIENADKEFEEGSIGAGMGMSCYGLKGGIGSSSRMVKIREEVFTIGILVMSNFGVKNDLIIDGVKAGRIITEVDKSNVVEEDKGSIIIIMATDIPMTHRQLKRVCKRTGVGLSRTGSFFGNGSGDIVVGFTTANKIKHYEEEATVNIRILNENKINNVFRAAAEATEEAILNSLICADTTKGRDGHIRKSLKEYVNLVLKAFNSKN